MIFSSNIIRRFYAITNKLNYHCKLIFLFQKGFTIDPNMSTTHITLFFLLLSLPPLMEKNVGIPGSINWAILEKFPS